jgi:hypothetical protein
MSSRLSVFKEPAMKDPRSASQKISRLIWRQRIVTWGSRGLLAAAALGSAGAWTWYRQNQIDMTVEAHPITATVTGLGRGAVARGISVVHAHTDDGREVDAFSTLRLAPAVGAHIVLSEAHHKSGRITYDLLHVVE